MAWIGKERSQRIARSAPPTSSKMSSFSYFRVAEGNAVPLLQMTKASEVVTVLEALAAVMRNMRLGSS